MFKQLIKMIGVSQLSFSFIVYGEINIPELINLKKIWENLFLIVIENNYQQNHLSFFKYSSLRLGVSGKMVVNLGGTSLIIFEKNSGVKMLFNQ